MDQAIKPPTQIETCLQALKHATVENLPPHIVGCQASNDQIIERAAHLEAVLNATLAYARAIMSDTQYCTCITLDQSPLDTLADSIEDLVGGLKDAACLRETEGA